MTRFLPIPPGMLLLVGAALTASALAVIAGGVDLASAPGIEAWAEDGGEGFEPALPRFLGLGHWVPAGQLSWREAHTGWQGISAPGVPLKGRSFSGDPLSIAGVHFDEGIGTYPFSEIEYDLGGSYALLRANVGVDDGSAPGAAAIFRVVVDGFTVHTTRPLFRGDHPLEVTVPLSGAQTVRLVAAPAPNIELVGNTNWADLALFLPALSVGEARSASRSTAAHASAALDPTEAHWVSITAEQETRYIEERARPAGSIVGVADPQRSRYALWNSEIALIFETGGPEPNTFTVLDRRGRRLLMHGVSLRARLDADRTVSLSRDAVIEEDNISFSEVREVGFRRGKALVARLRARSGGEVIVLRLTLFPGSRFFLVQADAPGLPAGQRVEYVFVFGDRGAGVVTGPNPQVLADLTRLRHVRVHDDGLAREIAFDPGKPAILWSEEASGAFLMAPIDETRSIPRLAVFRAARSARVSLSLATSNVPGHTSSPRIYVEAPSSSDLREVAANYKRFLDRAHPAPPLPEWVRFQWSSWYPFEMRISHELIARQVDLIAHHFADLGPWHLVLDGGWYVAEGRPGSDLRATDTAKFPQGIRALADYVHSRGMRLLMYTTAPYLDGHQKEGNWAGLLGTIQSHSEWLIPLGQQASGGAFAFNYSHPGARGYLGALLRDIFQSYAADGLLLDGLGSADERLVGDAFLDRHGLVPVVVDQTMEIYRLVWEGATRLNPGVYIEGGVHNPSFARRYAHTFRQADDAPAFSAPYPAGGLVEHIDYATYQKTILGQRPNMGALTEDEGGAAINLGWLQAGIALDSQVTLSFDLGTLTPEDVKEYRGLLNHYKPFMGTTRVDRILEPSVFVTHKDGLAYLGLLNRSFDERSFSLALKDYGFEATQYSVFDVTDKDARFVRGVFQATLRPRSFRLFVLTSQPKVVWTSSSFESEQGAAGLVLELTGPQHVAGVVKLVTPRPRRVILDGNDLAERPPWLVHLPGSEYTYGPGGLLTIEYTHDHPRRLEVEF